MSPGFSNVDRKSNRHQPYRNNKTEAAHLGALDLSSKLRHLSNQKRLRECLALYESPQYDHLRDTHHGSVVIDCCARCGDMGKAEKVVNVMLGRSETTTKANILSEAYIWENYDQIPYQKMPIQAWTALLKGYVHAGMMAKADSLFSALCRDGTVTGEDANGSSSKKRKRVEAKAETRANVRTLNTLLRGCLWSATSISFEKGSSLKQTKDSKKTERFLRDGLVGGLVTAERAWEEFNSNLGDTKNTIGCDSSSYEYFITLLCQSFRCEKAEHLLGHMKKQLNIPIRMSSIDPALVESMAVSLVALARAYALLGKISDCQRCTKEALSMMNSLNSYHADNKSHEDKNKSKVATGGKQAWKSNTNIDGSSYARREQSNVLFRSHRISELKSEAMSLSSYSKHHFDGDYMELTRIMLTRLLYFSGGGTTGLCTISDINASSEASAVDNYEEKSSDARLLILQWYNSLWFSFGLKELIDSLYRHKILNVEIRPNTQSHALTPEMCDRLRTSLLGEDYHVIEPNGFIDFKRVFSSLNSSSTGSLISQSTSSNDAPLHIELGSGSGDWATCQAELNPSDNYVTVELRADRVAQTFAKMVLGKSSAVNNTTDFKGAGKTGALANLCCVGSECGSFLREKICPGTVRTIFVNHPEPPTQTSTSDDEQAHMLNADTITAAAKCLEPAGIGRMVIVTDNLIYARLIARTLSKTLDRGKLSVVKPNEVCDLRKVESVSVAKNASFVHIYEGKPSASIGHYIPCNSTSVGGTSYFDRLWRTGAGKHADMKKRFIIVVRTVGGQHSTATTSTPTQRLEKSSSVTAGKKGSKKRSAEKQQQRNERRLLKKQQKQQQQKQK
ncbi:hypothetical protein HJC23_009904 [Cyclotella cryptica]|uniref:tRNA (guanine(46)-N(7))-methyltransferase n=1 Tax=Cyclotella cryptica TaxID=29204 RepID=A0ABD3QAZ5_9STRA|eukprot:CCRYP_007031-RA/>CCRYP_007031-RA protein AED:0.01 eAED:0.06 QI:0/-1/0/1/-1/1/1/0/846